MVSEFWSLLEAKIKTPALSLADTGTTSDVKLEKKIEPKEGYV